MKTLKIFIVFFISVFILSCSDDIEKIEVTLKQDGDVQIVLADSLGNPLADVVVELYYSSSSSEPIEEGKTDAKGRILFTNIIQGYYYAVINDVELNGFDYSISKLVAVVSGETKTYNIDPADYTGNAEIHIYSEYYDYTAGEYVEVGLSSVNVGLIPYEDYYNYYYAGRDSYDELLSIVMTSGITDSEGVVEFSEIPSGYYYMFVYADSNHYSTEGYIQIEIGETTTEYEYVTISDIMEALGDLSLNIYCIEYNSSTYGYDTIKVSNANVVLTDSYEYYLSSAITEAVATGVTDSDGRITFTGLESDSYYVYVYYSTSEYDYDSYYYVYPFQEMSYDVELDEDDLGL